MSETHLSVLHFTDDLVLKFKKALRLPFVDFTSLESRRQACVEEVTANRRLSPDVYLGVAEVRLDSAEGSAVLDHAVVMRRLPAERSLAELVRQGASDLDPALERLAAVLVDFHGRAERGPHVDERARPSALMATWQGCLDGLAAYGGSMVDGAALEEARRLALRYVTGRPALYEQRIAQGRVCDGHGDLLAGDIYLLSDGPRVLDCIEFDRRLRYLDVAADVAFLVMDLERLGAASLARLFLEAYQRLSGDAFPPTLFDNYVAERAAVRAEVACLRAAQTGAADGGEATLLLNMALDHLRRGRVVLGVVSGLPGTGKSTLAAALGERLGWPVLRSDEVRAELVDRGQQGPLLAAEVPGAYDAAVTERTYATLLEAARGALEMGQPVLLDATFSAPGWRQMAEALAGDTSSDLVVWRCQCPPEVAARRMRDRLAHGTDVSGADEKVARAMAASGGGAPWAGAIDVDTSGTVQRAVELALRAQGSVAAAGS